MFYLQYWPILGFKSMNKNKHAFFFFFKQGKKALNSLSFSPSKEGMFSVLERGPGFVSWKSKFPHFSLEGKI
jgi:hypothetical protein